MDDRTKEERSRTMAAVKSTGTGLEKHFFKALSERGLVHAERHPQEVFGKPDLILREERIAVFLDSCFWHGCPKHLRMPSSNRDYWEKKIRRNKRRDLLVTETLRAQGWLVVRIWEHSINNPRALKWWTARLATFSRNQRKFTDFGKSPD